MVDQICIVQLQIFNKFSTRIENIKFYNLIMNLISGLGNFLHVSPISTLFV